MKEFLKSFLKIWVIVYFVPIILKILFYALISMEIIPVKFFNFVHYSILSNISILSSFIISFVIYFIILLIKKENINSLIKVFVVIVFVGSLIVFFQPRYSWSTAWGSSIKGTCMGFIKTNATSTDSWNHTCFGLFVGSKEKIGGF